VTIETRQTGLSTCIKVAFHLTKEHTWSKCSGEGLFKIQTRPNRTDQKYTGSYCYCIHSTL